VPDATETRTAVGDARRRFGLWAGPAFALAFLLLPVGLAYNAHVVGAVLVLMVVFWVTEALPLAVTALLGPTLVVLLGAAPATSTFAPFADPVVFLFIGSFIVAEAMKIHGLDRRLAYSALASRWVGASGVRLIVTYAVVACVISMWLSNVATTVMLFPLGVAVLAELGRERGSDAVFRRYAAAMMLAASYGASIGGLGTPVGTPPNLIGMGLLRSNADIHISFTGWMLVGLPTALVLMAFLCVWLLVPRGKGIRLGPEAVRMVSAERDRLGPMTRGERNVVFAFSLTATLWIVPGLIEIAVGSSHPLPAWFRTHLPEAIVALLGGLLLFVLPTPERRERFTITWPEAVRIDWGIVILYGGGLAMGRLADTSGLSAALGEGVVRAFPDAGTVGLTMAFALVALVMSEMASNTASANIVVPMAIAVSQAAGVALLEPVLGATLGASLGFMLPVSTPPNAVVYSSGHIPLGAMVRHGVVLDVVGYFVVVGAVLALGRFVQ
jgi:sodium-dependent dicarboxylate transporter 2/3/5